MERQYAHIKGSIGYHESSIYGFGLKQRSHASAAETFRYVSTELDARNVLLEDGSREAQINICVVKEYPNHHVSSYGHLTLTEEDAMKLAVRIAPRMVKALRQAEEKLAYLQVHHAADDKAVAAVMREINDVLSNLS